MSHCHNLYYLIVLYLFRQIIIIVLSYYICLISKGKIHIFYDNFLITIVVGMSLLNSNYPLQCGILLIHFLGYEIGVYPLTKLKSRI